MHKHSLSGTCFDLSTDSIKSTVEGLTCKYPGLDQCCPANHTSGQAIVLMVPFPVLWREYIPIADQLHVRKEISTAIDVVPVSRSRIPLLSRPAVQRNCTSPPTSDIRQELMRNLQEKKLVSSVQESSQIEHKFHVKFSSRIWDVIAAEST